MNFSYLVEIPDVLSYMAFLNPNAYVPGIYDLVHGNADHGVPSYNERITKGEIAINALAAYKRAKLAGNDSLANAMLGTFEKNYNNFGYGYYANREVHELIPNITMSFYSFRIMVFLGLHFFALILVVLILTVKNRIENKKVILYTALWTIPLAYIASMLGWIVAEVGRQPWVIQDILPTIAAVSQLKASSVQLTFWVFAVFFTALLIAEIGIIVKQIGKGFTA